MVSLVHPGAVEDLTNYVAKEAFISALDDGWLKMRVMDRQPANIEQALGIAGRLEANESTWQAPAPPQELSKREARWRNISTSTQWSQTRLTGTCSFRSSWQNSSKK